jgi:hypothetical protein
MVIDDSICTSAASSYRLPQPGRREGRPDLSATAVGAGKRRPAARGPGPAAKVKREREEGWAV